MRRRTALRLAALLLLPPALAFAQGADPRSEYVPLGNATDGRLKVGAEVAAPEASPYLPDLEAPGKLESLGVTGLARYDLSGPSAPLTPYVGAGLGVRTPINDPDLLGADRSFLNRLDKTDVGSLGFLGVEAPLGDRIRLYGETRWRRDLALENLQNPRAKDDVGVFGGVEIKFGGPKR